jgi:hypothetical protein
MQGTGLPLLEGWQNFYLIIGTAAATLTGLMFVVITLIADLERETSILDAGVAAFNTPTIVHFGAVLLLAAILSAPWPAFSLLGLMLGLAGLAGVLYLSVVMRRMKRVPDYQTPLKDWLWYLVFPLIAYVALIAAAIALPANPQLVLYFVSAVMLALLFLGIHNAWDLVIFLAIERSHAKKKG